MKPVSLLPEELGRPQDAAGPQLPPADVAPLVCELGKVAMRLDVAADQGADDGLACRPDGQPLVQLAVASGPGDPGHLGRAALDVLGLLHQKLLRDEERGVPVLVTAG